jgi:hypothetical protein
MQRPIPVDDFQVLAREHATLAADGFIEQTTATAIERKESDHVDLARISLRYAGKGFAALRPLLDAINLY